MEHIIRKENFDCKIRIAFRKDTYSMDTTHIYEIEGFYVKAKTKGQKYRNVLPNKYDDFDYRRGYNNAPPKRNYKDDCLAIVKKYLTIDEINDCLLKEWETLKPKMIEEIK